MSGVWNAYKTGTKQGARQRARYGTHPVRAGYRDLQKVTKDVAYMKSLMNVEWKYHDSIATGQMSSTGTVQVVNAIPLGNNKNERVGQSVRIKSVEVKQNINGNNGADNTHFRCLLVYDKEGQTLPGINKILQDTTYPTVSPRNMQNRKRFYILRDIHRTMGDDGANTTQIDFFKKLDFHTIYDADTGNIAAVSTGALYVVYISNHTAVGPDVTSYVRIRYLDN